MAPKKGLKKLSPFFYWLKNQLHRKAIQFSLAFVRIVTVTNFFKALSM